VWGSPALARLAHVSRARITQIMNLLLLAPDIQEAILFLPRTDGHLADERLARRRGRKPDWYKEIVKRSKTRGLSQCLRKVTS